MSVEYRLEQRSSINDDFSTLLRETHEFFKQSQHVSILGEGIKDILSDNVLFGQYVDKLTEGTTAEEAENLRTLMENARVNVFLESSVAGIQPVASLTFPVIRKLWARTGLVKAVPTEVVKSNAFSVSFNKPYLIDEDGNRHYLPEALKEDKSGLAPKKKLEEDAIKLPLTEYDLLGAVGCSKATGDSVDMNFAISSVIFEDDVEVVIPRAKGLLDPNRKLYVEATQVDENGEEVASDVIFGFVDLVNGTINATSLKGAAKAIKIKGYVASDSHNRATNISFELDRRDFTIGTGEHFEASLPLEFLQDAMATYQIDGTTEVVDVMSNVIAQKLDMEIMNFLDGVYEGTAGKYLGEFDLRPSASFNGHPKDWREEIKTVIDYFATKIKSDSYAYQGYFALFGHSIDMMLIPNVNWVLNHSVDTQSGVEVDYNVGAISGQHRYTLVSSDLLTPGEITMLFIPTTNKFMSVKYYPYTFNVVNNYLNTQKSAIPNIMMTKRHTMEEFLPLIGKIKVLNNTGDLLKNLPR
jgi:hypothetical protein